MLGSGFACVATNRLRASVDTIANARNCRCGSSKENYRTGFAVTCEDEVETCLGFRGGWFYGVFEELVKARVCGSCSEVESGANGWAQ